MNMLCLIITDVNVHITSGAQTICSFIHSLLLPSSTSYHSTDNNLYEILHFYISCVLYFHCLKSKCYKEKTRIYFPATKSTNKYDIYYRKEIIEYLWYFYLFIVCGCCWCWYSKKVKRLHRNRQIKWNEILFSSCDILFSLFLLSHMKCGIYATWSED